MANYDLGQLLSYRRIKVGFANRVVYLETTKGQYIVKIIIRNNPVRVKYEVDLLNFISGLPTPKPIPTKSGRYLIKFNQVNKAFIYSYLLGRQQTRFNNRMLNAVGRLLGRLHSQTMKFKSSVKRTEMYNIDYRALIQIIGKCKKLKVPKLQEALAYIHKELPKYFLPKQLPTGAMHIDFKPENTLFVKNKINGLIDFDNSYNGPLILDLANTLMWYCSNSGIFNVKKARIIFAGYKQTRQLTKQEKYYLYDALQFAFLSHMLIDIYYMQKDLPRQYILWGLKNLLKTQKQLAVSKRQFQLLFD